ncbi:MAG TPA: wax ester/triacylglycerol synthase domain-containing protein, partial [Streptosporangiaceae bacterium]
MVDIDMSLNPLSDEDASILALEAGTIRGHTLKILVLDGRPPESVVPLLSAQIESGLATAPRWRQRLVPAPGAATGLAWQEDPDFDISQHVSVVTGDEVTDEALRQLSSATMTEALDRGRPLWSIGVVPRMTGRRWALIWKIHHCLADGAAMMRAGSALLWTEPEAGRRPSGTGSRPSSADWRSGAAGSSAARRHVPGQLRAGTRLAALASHRGLMYREFRRLGPLSPLAADVGPDRTVAFARCDFDDLRAAKRAISPPATINDVLMAAVAGALRRWLEERGAPVTALKAQVPVSMHPDPGTGEPQGNRDSFLLVGLPIAEADPLARLRAVNAATRRRKNRHDAQAIDALRRTMARMPSALRRPVRHLVQGPHEYSLNVSNIPGPATPIYVLDHRARALYSVAEIAPRHALRISAISLAG